MHCSIDFWKNKTKKNKQTTRTERVTSLSLLFTNVLARHSGKVKNRPPPVLPLFYYAFPFPTASAISAWWQYESCSSWAKRSHTRALPPNASLELKATKDASAVRTFKFSQISRREQRGFSWADVALLVSSVWVPAVCNFFSPSRLTVGCSGWTEWPGISLAVALRTGSRVFREPLLKLQLLWCVGQKFDSDCGRNRHCSGICCPIVRLSLEQRQNIQWLGGLSTKKHWDG